jgi:SulP family sulfate permease
VIVGIVALPLAVAFAIARGLPPERGLCTAFVAGFLISALGGSRVQIGGPTGAFVVIVAGVVQAVRRRWARHRHTMLTRSREGHN